MNYTDHTMSDSDLYGNIKIEYHDPTDVGRVVSQTFTQKHGRPLSKARKILSHVETSGNNFPRTAIKRISGESEGEVILMNGIWDKPGNYASSGIMHNIHQSQEFSSFHLQKFGANGESSKDLVSPRGSDSGIESDYADGSLSWLLNYKIRELPPVPDGVSSDNLNNTPSTVPQPPITTPQTSINEVVISENCKTMQQYANNLHRKPPFTYTEMIEHALSETGELTVSGIYNWISYHFPFYKANDDRWKNSVRHNLSINPHFRKGERAVQGAGHFWTIAQRDVTKSWQMRQRINEFLRLSKAADTSNNETENLDKELQAATESILEEIQSQDQNEQPVQADSHPNVHVNDDIHVEYMNIPEGVTGLEEFLSPPVPKEDIVHECGLGSDFFITDIDPNQLGLSLAETDVGDDRMYEDITLEYYGMKE
ncbi:forkhead box protein J1-A-like isoform X1 [Euwallacea similis]|uniref:forkhead box protein J1-A-like isoform X1 n=1 Tax=Euwallacea similis TaxID=1736056 RepID=UPI00344D18D5